MHRRGYKGRKLGRTAAPRKALLRNLATSIILYEKVKTTKAKAKEVQPIVEKLITLAKKGDLQATKRLFGFLLDDKAAIKLKTELAPVYKNRKGGYTRVLNLGFRDGDGAKEAMIELLDTEKILKKEAKVKETKADKEEVKEVKNKVEEKKEAPKTKAKSTVKKTTKKA